MSKLIDIIIPMYNRAHCIPNLINTLMRQTLQDFRVIFVDDGSTDNTQQVLQEALAAVPFPTVVIHQENAGAGAARNTGLRASDAQWSVFVDSDDTLLPEYLEYLYNAASSTNADFGFCDFKMIPAESDFQEPPAGDLKFSVLSAGECMKVHYSNWLSNACLIINGDFRRKNSIFYDEECTYTEDNNFLTDLIVASETVVKLENVLYLYHIHQGSRSRNSSAAKFISGVESFRKMEKKLENNNSGAAEVFRSMAAARYYLATYRKAAVQLAYSEFRSLAKQVPFAPYKRQLASLPGAQRLAGSLLLVSRTLFYFIIRVLFKD